MEKALHGTGLSRKLIFLSALLLGILSFTACKKYEEGPSFSLRSKTDRLTGEWKVVVFKYYWANQTHGVTTRWEKCDNGIDSFENTTTGFADYSWTVTKEGVIKEVVKNTVYRNNLASSKEQCKPVPHPAEEKTWPQPDYKWEFVNDKDQLKITKNVTSTGRTEWILDIIMLKNNRVKLIGKEIIYSNYSAPKESQEDIIEIELEAK